MFHVRPWLLVAFLCVLSAAGGSGATRKLLEDRDRAIFAAYCAGGPRQETMARRADPKPAPALVIHAPHVFDSANEAAVSALAKAYELSPYYEHGGVILRGADGKFRASYPATDYHGDSLEIDEDPLPYTEYGTVVATYHTHPCLPLSHVPDVFSPQDLKSDRITNHEGFLLDTCSGEVHAFMPGVDKIEPHEVHDLLELVLGNEGATAKGRIVGHVSVTGARLETATPHFEEML